MRQWIPEERQRQAEIIKNWKPWEHSTGAKTAQGRAIASRNAYKGGVMKNIKELRRLLREQSKIIRDF